MQTLPLQPDVEIATHRDESQRNQTDNRHMFPTSAMAVKPPSVTWSPVDRWHELGFSKADARNIFP